MGQNSQPPKFQIPDNAITKSNAHILTDQGIVAFVQQAEGGISLVNPVTLVLPFDAILQIAAQLILYGIQVKQMQQIKPLPGNLPMPPGFTTNGRKAGG